MKKTKVLLSLFMFTGIPIFSQEIETQIGPQQTILKSGDFGLEYFPDMALSVLETTPVFKALLVSGISTYLIEGKDIYNIKSAIKVISPGSTDDFDNGYAGVSGVIKSDKGIIYAVYHGEDQKEMPPIPGGIPGFYCSIGLAVSSDSGNEWKKFGPIITSSKPKSWCYYSGQTDRGEGEPWVILNKEKTYFYLYYADHSRQGGRGIQICMARAPADKPPLPGTWKKYYQSGFRGPGLGGEDTPVLSVHEFNDAEALAPNVVYSSYLNKYIMTFNYNVWKEYVNGTGLKESGIYITYSDNGIYWSTPQKLITDYSVALIGKSVSWHPSILWDDTIQKSGLLVYGYSPGWGHTGNHSGTPHYMVGRKITFELTEKKNFNGQ